MTPAHPGFGVYVHWPFCRSRCPYCDFNSHVRVSLDEAAWRRALVRETAFMAALAPGREVTSVFFGGGTPSLMSARTVGAVLDAVAAGWPVAADAEVTLEANPSSAEASRFAGYRAAGVNRISLGVQALDDRSLAALGRGHDADEARAALALARKVFTRVSFDLIYARMGQTCGAWRLELAQALALAADHLSLYQLTVEPGTRFFALQRSGALELPGEDERAAMRETALAMTGDAGLPAYEISNHARPGHESRHNLTYWRSGEWAGVGPGAHGRLNEPGGRSVERRQARMPGAWLAAVERDGHGTAATETIAGADRLAEVLMMGLRLTRGLDAADLRRAAGLTLDEALEPGVLAELEGHGLLARDGAAVRATPRGQMVLNAVLARLLETPNRAAA